MAFPFSPRIYTPIVIVAGLLWLLQPRTIADSFADPLLKRNVLAFATLYAIQIIGLAYTTEPMDAFRELETKSSLLVLPPMILLSGLSDHATKTIFRMFLVSVFAICLILLCHAVINAISQGHGFLEFVSGNQYQTTNFTAPLDIHPTYLSLFASLCIFFLIDNLGNATSRTWIAFSIVLAFFFVCINLLLLSRGALIGFSVGAMAIIIHKYWVIRRKYVPATFAIIGLIGFIATAFALMPNFQYRFADQIRNLKQYWNEYHPDNSTSLHLHSWKCALELIGERPVFGYGTGAEVEQLIGCYRQGGFVKSFENRYNAHNEFLSSMLNHGIIGIAILVAFFVHSFRMAWHYRDSLLMAVLLLFLVASCFESTLNVYRGVVFLGLFQPLLVHRLVIQIPS